MHRCVDRPEELTVGRARYLDLLSPEDSKMRPDLRGRSMRAQSGERRCGCNLFGASANCIMAVRARCPCCRHFRPGRKDLVNLQTSGTRPGHVVAGPVLALGV